jgi:hypothetical protein
MLLVLRNIARCGTAASLASTRACLFTRLDRDADSGVALLPSYIPDMARRCCLYWRLAE